MSIELNLLILGAGNYDRDVKEIAESLHVFNKIFFADEIKSDGTIGACKLNKSIRALLLQLEIIRCGRSILNF